METTDQKADPLIDEMQAITPKQQRTSTDVPKFRKPLKIVIVNRRGTQETTKPTTPSHSSPTSPSKMASKKRKADVLVKDMETLAKNILKKHKLAREDIDAVSRARKPLKIVFVDSRKTKHTGGNGVVDVQSVKDNMDTTGPRTTFLDLPRELRQSILLLARPWRTAWMWEKEWIAQSVSILREVHPRLLKDVEYVEEKWMRSLTEELKGAGFTWKSLKKQEENLYYRRYWVRFGSPGTSSYDIRLGRACEGDSGKQ